MPCTPPVSGPSPLTFTAPHSGAFSSVHCCLPFLPHFECLSRPFLPRSVGDASSIPRSGRSPGGGNGNALQYSCLENPTDRAKSQTWLSNLTLSSIALSTHYKCSSWAHPFPQFLLPSWAFISSSQFLHKLNRVNKKTYYYLRLL